MRSPRRISSRFSVLCLSIAYLVLQLGGAWHLARGRHARCAEHGEWIDVAHQPSAAQSEPARGPIAERFASTQAHDHCVLVEASRIRAVVCDGAPMHLAHEAPASIVPPRSDDPLDVGFDRYLLAPKQSPPC